MKHMHQRDIQNSKVRVTGNVWTKNEDFEQSTKRYKENYFRHSNMNPNITKYSVDVF